MIQNEIRKSFVLFAVVSKGLIDILSSKYSELEAYALDNKHNIKSRLMQLYYYQNDKQ